MSDLSATTSQHGEPLATRLGVIGEVLNSNPIYPTIFVVVRELSQIPVLQRMLLAACGQAAKVTATTVTLQNGVIQFGLEQAADVYRGTIPVFYDPGMIHRSV